ncbi:unnamed protein product [Boreogadus saida]
MSVFGSAQEDGTDKEEAGKHRASHELRSAGGVDVRRACAGGRLLAGWLRAGRRRACAGACVGRAGTGGLRGGVCVARRRVRACGVLGLRRRGGVREGVREGWTCGSGMTAADEIGLGRARAGGLLWREGGVRRSDGTGWRREEGVRSDGER